MKSDGDLLREFATAHDEACFAELVQRHIRFVHAVSLRRLRDPAAAQEATQAVFIALARKARSVADAPSISGWLHRSACFETSNLMRTQRNRLARESEAHRLGTTTPEARPHLEAIAAVLDDVLCELSQADRDAIIARYFSEQSYAAIGTALQTTENTARMRVDRALAKLRDRLERRGVSSSAAALAAALPAYASAKVPAEMAGVITKGSLGAAAAGGAAIVGFMSTAKVVTGVAVAAAVGGFIYERHARVAVENEVVAVRAESAGRAQQIQAIQKELAGLKQAQQATAKLATSRGGNNPADPKVDQASQPPIPGVTPKAPKGWFKNGNAPELYEVGVDENNSWGGMPSAYAKSTGPAEGKFGGMMQSISADSYRGERIKMSAWMKTEDANDGGGHLWLRVDGQESGKILQADNMDGRAPKGTTDWQEYSIVLDVPNEATSLNYGLFLAGRGKAWVNGLTITPVGTDVTSTNMLKQPPALPKAPVNLGFNPPTTSQ